MLSSFELPDDPFKRTREDMDQLKSLYAWSEKISRGACKLVNNCQLINIIEELEKLVQQLMMATLEAKNKKFKT